MYNKILATAEKEVIRGEILNTCYMAGEGGADTKIIRSILKKSGYDLDECEIKAQSDYLAQKGLVSVENVSNKTLGIRRVVIHITALGIDYLEGNATNITGIGG